MVKKIMLKNPIVQELLIDVTDDEKNSTTIIECLLAGKTVDLEIVEETEIPLNIVRKVLYKLNDATLISYKKTKNISTICQYFGEIFLQVSYITQLL